MDHDHELGDISQASYISFQTKEEDERPVLMSGSESSSYYSSSDDESDNQPSKVSSHSGTGIGKQSKRLSSKALKAIEGVSLFVAVTVVLSLFSLPILFYKAELTKNQNTTNTGEPTPSNSTDNCNLFSWAAASSAQCSGTPYLEDGMCKDYLRSWQKCSTEEGLDGPLMVAVSTNMQQDLEETVRTLFQALDNFPQSTTADCIDIAVPFACLYFFPLCDRSGKAYLPSQELCLNISTVVCLQQWRLAQNLELGNQLPVCANLPKADHTPNTTATPTGPPDVLCAFGFTLNNGGCIPDCYTYLSGPKKSIEANRIIVAVAVGFGLLVSVVFFIASFVRRRKMWKFPYVFLIYVTMDYTIMGFFILLSLSDRGLYCNSNNALDAVSNPTTYCTITGVVIHYFVVNMTYFWFFHVCSTFYKVMFPHLARRTESKQSFIHLGLVLLAIILPLPPVVVVLTNDKYQYTIPAFPTYFCLSQSTEQIVFDSIILVVDLLLAVGTCLFIPMFYVIHKYRHSIGTKKKGMWRISSIGRKLLLTLCYFVVFGVVSMVYLAVLVADQKKIIEIQQTYFFCEFPGISSENSSVNCSLYLQDLNSYNALRTVTYTLLGLLPLVIFIFMLDWKRMLKKVNIYKNRYCLSCIRNKEELMFSTYSPVSVTSIN